MKALHILDPNINLSETENPVSNDKFQVADTLAHTIFPPPISMPAKLTNKFQQMAASAAASVSDNEEIQEKFQATKASQ
jgi:hypothetical protein